MRAKTGSASLSSVGKVKSAIEEGAQASPRSEGEAERSTSTQTPFNAEWIRGRVPSRNAAQRHLLDLQDALTALRSNRRPHLRDTVWPFGLDRSLLNELPLGVRIFNCLANAHLMEGDGALRAQQLLRLPNFGAKSLNDFLITVESFLNECVRIGSRESHHSVDVDEGTRDSPDSCATATASASEARTQWGNAGQVLNPLLATAAELYGVRTPAHVLGPQIVELAKRIGILSSVDGIRIDHVTGGSAGLVSIILGRVTKAIGEASAIQREVIEHRLLRAPPMTLQEVGVRVGLTRERIRQVQANLEQQVEDALGNETRIVASVLKERLGHVVEESEVECQFDEILRTEHRFARALIRRALLDQMGFTLNSGVFCDEQATKVLNDIRKGIHRLADDVGLVNEQEAISSLPSEEWRRFWPWVRDRCKLIKSHGSLGIRDTAKARAKAALISIGRPATREEIARACGNTKMTVRKHLANVPSVVRADKYRWGLKEWIDDEYNGISGEISQQIDQDGGATTVKKLLTELPRKFGVKKTSVRAYMNAPKFVINDGWIRLASKSSIRLRNLEDVIDGRDNTGAPYWAFLVDARYFSGGTLQNVPPEIANALGCGPDSSERVQIENLPKCRDLSIHWNLASLTDASLGRLAEALEHLGVEPGDRVRLAITGHCRVKLMAGE